MECIQYATLPDDIVIIRVAGRANYQNSLALKQVFEKTSSDQASPQYVFDLERCDSMDSTFMGVVASIGLHQKRLKGTKSTVLNVTPHVRELLDHGWLHLFAIDEQGRVDRRYAGERTWVEVAI